MFVLMIMIMIVMSLVGTRLNEKLLHLQSSGHKIYFLFWIIVTGRGVGEESSSKGTFPYYEATRRKME